METFVLVMVCLFALEAFAKVLCLLDGEYVRTRNMIAVDLCITIVILIWGVSIL